MRVKDMNIEQATQYASQERISANKARTDKSRALHTANAERAERHIESLTPATPEERFYITLSGLGCYGRIPGPTQDELDCLGVAWLNTATDEELLPVFFPADEPVSEPLPRHCVECFASNLNGSTVNCWQCGVRLSEPEESLNHEGGTMDFSLITQLVHRATLGRDDRTIDTIVLYPPKTNGGYTRFIVMGIWDIDKGYFYASEDYKSEPLNHDSSDSYIGDRSGSYTVNTLCAASESLEEVTGMDDEAITQWFDAQEPASTPQKRTAYYCLTCPFTTFDRANLSYDWHCDTCMLCSRWYEPPMNKPWPKWLAYIHEGEMVPHDYTYGERDLTQSLASLYEHNLNKYAYCVRIGAIMRARRYLLRCHYLELELKSRRA